VGDTAFPFSLTIINIPHPYHPTIPFMSGLGERLERLGLAQYHDVFVAEGFDTWETLLDITESDLLVHRPHYRCCYADADRNALNVKLGHRRVCSVFCGAVDMSANTFIRSFNGQ